jgi:hypothetical protein
MISAVFEQAQVHFVPCGRRATCRESAASRPRAAPWRHRWFVKCRVRVVRRPFIAGRTAPCVRVFAERDMIALHIGDGEGTRQTLAIIRSP